MVGVAWFGASFTAVLPLLAAWSACVTVLDDRSMDGDCAVVTEIPELESEAVDTGSAGGPFGSVNEVRLTTSPSPAWLMALSRRL